MPSENIAKTAILSSLITIVILLGISYLVREPALNYLQGVVVTSIPVLEMVPVLDIESDITATIERVNPAVVSVVVTKDLPIYERYYETFNPLGLFGGFSVPRVRENGTEEREVGGGSGFIVSNDGLIVTNRHVVEDKDARYSVLLNDGIVYQVVVMDRDPQLDIAILKIIEPLKEALTFVTFGDSETLKLGQTVIAIGNALAEFRNSVSVGVVSGLARSVVASDGRGNKEQLDQVIQTDAAINPGNSGGPLLNRQGEVIGVNVAASQGAENIGFALPVQVVKRVVDSVREYGEIVVPFIGVRYMMLDEQIAEIKGLAVSYGALVLSGDGAGEVAVIPGSPADLAGITDQTIIIGIDGVSLRDRDLVSVLRTKTIGQEISLQLIQAGEEKVVLVTLIKAL